jgi:hypothetical protein
MIAAARGGGQRERLSFKERKEKENEMKQSE